MTEQGLIAAIEATGATDVWVMSRPATNGGRAVGVTLLRDGIMQRHAAVVAKTAPDNSVFEALLAWSSDVPA